ncbi:MAG: DUF1360 domain-containing protein [Armatimonadota bacterium]
MQSARFRLPVRRRTGQGELRSGLAEALRDSRTPWIAGIMGTFILLSALLIWWRWPLPELRTLLTPFNLVLFALASYRAGRIIAFDDVARPLRSPFVEVWEDEEGELQEEPVREGLRGAIGGLLTCPDCAGFWFAVLLIYSAVLWPEPARLVAFVFAANGLGHVLTGTIMLLRAQSGHTD